MGRVDSPDAEPGPPPERTRYHRRRVSRTSSRILITGASGLLGSHLARAYADEGVLALSHIELDITDSVAVNAIAERLRPHLIFNCAVIGVDDCEARPGLAERINVDGPGHLARAAAHLGATIVHFSSNYVFDGRRTTGLPYTVDDEARPVNVYGATKLRGELAVAAACERAFIVRTSWVFGAGKASFLSTVAARLAAGERVQAITDTFASTTFVGDLVSRLRAIIPRKRYGTYQLVNDGVCSYETFAEEAARLAGVNGENLIVRTTEAALGRLAPRPRWTPMRCVLSERLGLDPLPPWQDALARYLSL